MSNEQTIWEMKRYVVELYHIEAKTKDEAIEKLNHLDIDEDAGCLDIELVKVTGKKLKS